MATPPKAKVPRMSDTQPMEVAQDDRASKNETQLKEELMEKKQKQLNEKEQQLMEKEQQLEEKERQISERERQASRHVGIGETTQQLKNSFYFIDICKPVRYDALMAESPPKYDLDDLPDRILTPKMTNKSLNNGFYKFVRKHKNGAIYFYVFPSTEQASSATFDNLDLGSVSITYTRGARNILPPEPTQTQIHLGLVPVRFIWTTELYESLQECALGFLHLSDKPGQTADSVVESVYQKFEEKATPSDENMINQNFRKLLKLKLPDFIIKGEEKSMGTDCFSRFHTSKEDFSFYHEHAFTQCQEELMSATATAIPSANPSEEMYDRDCLESASGEAKKNTNKNTRWQLLANMVKVSADMARTAVLAGVLFKKIVTYGLLVDYNCQETKTLMKLDMNFVAKVSQVYCSEDTLPLEESFSRVADVLRHSVVQRQ